MRLRREAFKSGLNKEEVARRNSHSVEGCPEEEMIAILSAQHWAESNVHPAPEAVQNLQKVYGDEVTEAINLVPLIPDHHARY